MKHLYYTLIGIAMALMVIIALQLGYEKGYSKGYLTGNVNGIFEGYNFRTVNGPVNN